MPGITGEYLNLKWKIGVRQARYREDGCWYAHLERFPAAFCDAHGYIVFETKAAYEQCPQLQHGEQVNIRRSSGGISSIPGYVRIEDSELL